MKETISVLVVLVLSMISFACNDGEEDQEAEYEWGNLRNLGPNINSPAKDEHITFVEDGETAYFASTREGGVGNYDIYESRLIDGEWTVARPLPTPVNTERDDFDPFVTLDGKMLFFASNRHNEDTYWNCDIYVCDWDGERWSEPRIFDETFCTPQKPDWGAAIPRDFEMFYFSSGRGMDESNVQMFYSRRVGDKWSEPVLMPEPVNSGKWEATPHITPDGRTLYLNSGRGPEEKEDVDIWRFDLVNGEWTRPQRMEGPFLSEGHDYDPCISPDGTRFYFTSTREGGLGGADIYVAERTRKR